MSKNQKIICQSFCLFLFLFFCSNFAVAQQTIAESEPNDSFVNANVVDVLSSNNYTNITAAINPVGDNDKFRFQISGLSYIKFETFDASGVGCANGIDTLVRLYRSDQTALAQDDDSGINACSSLSIAVSSGTFFINVEDYGNDTTIPAYLLKISLTREVEPNNSIADANASSVQISSNISIAGSILPASDQDYFQVTLATPQTVRFETFDFTGTTCVTNDSVLDLYDSNGNSVARDDDSGIDRCSLAEIRLPANIYYIRIESYGNLTGFPYVLKINMTPTSFVNEFESNNTFTQANLSPIQISSNLDIIGAINPAADIDKFRLNLAEPKSVKFETFDELGTSCNQSIDTFIRLYDSNGTEIVSDDDSGISRCSLLELSLAAGIYYIQVEEFQNNDIIPAYLLRMTIIAPIPTNSTVFDFDGDSKTDVSIFRPAPGEWWYLKSSDGGNSAFTFGTSADKLVPADYTGDGKTDIAFWRPSTGQWFILRSEDSSFYAFPFGASGDIPAPADYDGDNKADAAVFRPAIATWFISKSSGGTEIIGFGASGDKPAIADYDGDGRADVAIWRQGVGEWWYRKSSDAQTVALQFGTSADKPMPGDYTGDGKADIAFFRQSTGFWYVLRSEDSSFFAFPFGASGDVPVSGDYDGDGRIDAAVYRASSATWFLNRSTTGVQILNFGIAGDNPVPNAFVP